jgi:hypothetical protein
MLTLTNDAQSNLERYLRRVKAALRGYPSVDADEVERDIRGHIEAELADSPAPITAPRLGNVLERLGSPNQWVPFDELPAWRKVLIRLSAGPEDWRLAYATFALLVTGLLLGPLGPVLILASVPVARATLALLDERDEPVGARRWLVYPSLVAAYFVIALVLFFLPVAPVAAAADPSVRAGLLAWLPAPFWLSYSSLVALVAGIWWTTLGLLLTRFRHAVIYVFWPFADRFDRRHGMRVAYAGLTVATIAGIVLAAVARG